MGLADRIIERLPWTGSFIHAGGDLVRVQIEVRVGILPPSPDPDPHPNPSASADQGEAKRLSLRPRRATVS